MKAGTHSNSGASTLANPGRILDKKADSHFRLLSVN
jgi:hypothetical protein